MVTASEQLDFTAEQEKCVWDYICSKYNWDDPDEVDPNLVVDLNYEGNRHRYIQDMAKHHGIQFCLKCRKAKPKPDEDILRDTCPCTH